jgi:hypothetical protein
MVTAGLAVVVGSQATHFHTAPGVAALGAGAPPALLAVTAGFAGLRGSEGHNASLDAVTRALR